ncbi:MAG: hypothetical protein A2359_03720 [Candidatus Moranbacteria bacterium RIFOXYB1_FULL_43_19]|nr:MAG: hypothetical protein A2184_02290 [Candidatus Moranbacteria bacterium RIFOXYA1_FULL_44_7]OGI26753.1 MAG: hypothetical protein A2359_03720 [Candidatus Moranbacteria bacterium RIFOXYB1_FULL_43_19]OGI32480.1 MAG: hypothetical protein A2420_03905 [Candidatus Moranbacteria bacterium RIFOXYC1_FULL_44_13]OGI37637.1 MAG: hypothetical protein A2612_04405 [Candidatus Moranbacteria bacterium RIFOXYD1_FULL_44_12]
MARRIKTKNRSVSTKTIFSKQFPAQGIKARKDLRFNISLVFLIAMLSISVYLLLFSMTENGKAFRDSSSLSPKTATVSPVKAVSPGEKKLLDDSALDFKLSVPSQLGQWMYRIGNVKGLTDDSLSNQFVKIYVAQRTAGSSTSFDDCYKDVLTLRKFSAEEWDEIEKGCSKGNLLYCEEAGTKINEKDGSVWAYTKSDNCSKETKANCASIEKIIGSFEFK